MSLVGADAPRAFFAHLRRGIGPRLLLSVLLFSSAVTLVLTAFQLYLDYRYDVGVIERRLGEIERGNLDTIGESLWQLDQTRLQIELRDVMRLPDIRMVEVRRIAAPDPLTLSLGERATRAFIGREMPIFYIVAGERRQVGALYVEASLVEVYRQLRNKALVILASQGAKTFLVSLFILYIFHLLVTRHLVSIAESVRRYDQRRPAPPLRLNRRPPRRRDELDEVVAALNALWDGLQRTHDDLHHANAELTRDVAARREAEAALRDSEQRFRDYAEVAFDWFWETDAEHRFTYVSERIAAFGFHPNNLIGRRCWDAAADLEEEPEKWRRHFQAIERHEPFRGFAYRIAYADGRPAFVESSGKPIFDAAGVFVGYRGGGRDVTVQREVEVQLQQAQKLAAVGHLTGGMAHDFNNLLTVVIGNLDLALERMPDEPRAAAQTALHAAQRAATLVHHLLAFSRRQTLRPEPLDLNRLAVGMAPLLRRSLGEQVEFEAKLQPELWPALADRAQVESALLNLAINARDAMPAGGRLTIETANKHLDDAYAAQNVEVTTGDYVMLAVSDTGTGMPPEILKRAVEPFFTTKEVGMGSGLGLSMIYGFAKQSGGHLKIYSEPGHGTTVRLYLPRALEPSTAAESASPEPTGGSETILVVEDNADVRRFVSSQLKELGYRVIEAAAGPQAQAILAGDEPIDLLLTDVVMPGGITGPQLAQSAKRQRPGIKLLYASGHAENAIVRHGILEPGVHFLAKPYRRQELALSVRAVLDSPD
jgi:PAS domain S-box-containing protein